MSALVIRRPDDWHLHLRDGAALAAVLPFTAARFARAIVMPNLRPPVLTAADAVAYRERIRAALPRTSLLLMGPMDRGTLTGGDIVTPDSLEKLIDVQKHVAAETGCAFFNTFHAMGGAGTMGRWYHAQPRLVSADFMHPLPAGAATVGALFEGALMQSYEASR